MHLTKICYVLLLVIVTFVACDRSGSLANKSSQHKPVIDVERSARRFATEHLGIAKDVLDHDYEVKVMYPDGTNTAICDFYSHELIEILGYKSAEDMFGGFGGFPGYFSITVSRVTGMVLESHASEE